MEYQGKKLNNVSHNKRIKETREDILNNVSSIVLMVQLQKEKIDFNQGNGFILGAFSIDNEHKFLRASEPLSTLVIASPCIGKNAGIITPNSSVILDYNGEIFAKTTD